MLGDSVIGQIFRHGGDLTETDSLKLLPYTADILFT
jgi:hypothetical protein